MLNKHGNNSRLMWVMLAILALGVAAAMVSCRAPQPVVITQRDSTHTERVVTYRDTVITVPGDRAVLQVGTETAALRRLLDQLHGEVRTIRGANQAVLELRATNDTLTVTALCNELQMRLDSALVQNNVLRTDVRTLAAFVAAQPEKQAPMPAWAKGTALVAGCVAAVLLLTALLPMLKQLFSHGKA